MPNVIVYNIPDSTNIKIARNTLLQECGLSQSWFVTRRLRKGHTKASCPTLFQFGSTTEANHLAVQRRICNGTQTDQPSLRSRGSYSSCHCTNPKISYTAPPKNGGTSDTAISPKDKTAHKAATTTHPQPKHSATPKCQTTYALIASKYYPSGPCKMPKNDLLRNNANSYKISDTAVRNNTKLSVKTHQYSSTPNPKRTPSHSNRIPYSKHSELASPTHPNVKRHLTSTTPTRDTHKSSSVNLVLNDIRSKIESLAISLSKHDNLKHEIETTLPIKLLLSKYIVPAERDDIIKAESVLDFIANEVSKRIVSRNNVIVYNIPERSLIQTVRNSILKASDLQDSPCQCIRLNKKHQKYYCPVLFRFDYIMLAEQLKESERLNLALMKLRNALIVSDKTANLRLSQKRTLEENKVVEITISHDASAAGSTDPNNY
ncbi:unnamed protein product [Schistosoma margrebowiei]|uniref:Uncharacterized protein n=1 Tax=Schistosoma margrebowiei TaxID=48269 RepID=A0A183MZN3_9TREM|nr:unnamed protein product [Schistosoma margrebowiei]